MVMWNLVGHGVKLAVRGLDAFSRTDAGKKTAEFSSKAFRAAKEASKDAIKAYKESRAAAPGRIGSKGDDLRWRGGETVVTSDGRVGVIVRYLAVSEIGGDSSVDAISELVLVDLLQHANELDRYLIIHQNSVRTV